MFKLAHFSDPHLGPLPSVSWQQLFSKRITGYLNWKFNREKHFSDKYLNSILTHMKAQNPDHIVLTGDLINLGLIQEISNASQWLETIAAPDRLSIIGGNHDAYVPGAKHDFIKSWKPYLTGDNENEVFFPYVRKRGPIVIFGCSSSNATLPFQATGIFSRKQATDLTQELDKYRAEYRVVLIHHPPFEGANTRHKRLVGDALFRKAIKAVGANLILHGHTHIHSHQSIDGPEGPIPVIGAPSTSNGPGMHKPPGAYNVFEIEKVKDKWLTQFSTFGIIDADAKVVQHGSPIEL